MERKNKKYDDITSPVFQTVVNEYKSVFERSRSIDARAGILMTFMITALPFYFQTIKLEELKKILLNDSINFLQFMQFFMFVLSITTFIVALIFLVIVLCSKKFKIFNASVFFGFDIVPYEDKNATINDMNVTVFNELIKAIKYNTVVVDKKANKFRVSLWISFAYTVSTILTILIMI